MNASGRLTCDICLFAIETGLVGKTYIIGSNIFIPGLILRL
jgi:hypothetical protein